MKNFKQVFLESQQTGIGSLTSLNESKIELCLFHRNSKPQISVEVNGVQITSQPSINLLGGEFDSRLQWGVHVSNAIKKAKRSLHAIQLI